MTVTIYRVHPLVISDARAQACVASIEINPPGDDAWRVYCETSKSPENTCRSNSRPAAATATAATVAWRQNAVSRTDGTMLQFSVGMSSPNTIGLQNSVIHNIYTYISGY